MIYWWCIIIDIATSQAGRQQELGEMQCILQQDSRIHSRVRVCVCYQASTVVSHISVFACDTIQGGGLSDDDHVIDVSLWRSGFDNLPSPFTVIPGPWPRRCYPSIGDVVPNFLRLLAPALPIDFTAVAAAAVGVVISMV